MGWEIWIAIGIICMIIEIITPGFWFFSFGVGAIITGIAGRPFDDNILIQLIIFSVSTLISFLLMKRFAGFLLKKDTDNETNIYALKDKKGIVTKIILPHQKGYVKINGEEWSAVSDDPTISLSEGSLVKIQKVEGNKVIVILDKQEE